MKLYKQQFVLGFIFNNDLDKVLLVKKNRSPIPEMVGKLNGIGGHCELGEDIYDTMFRECQEETGLSICEWIHFCDLNASEGLVHCFYATTEDIYNFQQLEDEELNIFRIDDFYDVYSAKNYEWLKSKPHMANIDWLIPMAINMATGDDKADFFEINEIF